MSPVRGGPAGAKVNQPPATTAASTTAPAAKMAEDVANIHYA